MRDPKARTMVRFHKRLLLLWVVLIPLSFWWRDLVMWVTFMSHYAIIVGHWSGWDAARAEEKADAG